MSRSKFAALIAASVLTACGGGGGDSGSTATPQAKENAAVGGWAGKTTDGEDVMVIVLDSGEVWGLVAEAGVSVGIFHAPGSATNSGAFSASEPRLYSFGAGKFIAASMSGTVNASTFSGSASGPGGSVGFSLAKNALFNQQATLANVAGTWSGSYGSLSGVDTLSGVSVKTDGSVTATDGSCKITGSLAPRAGVALYDVSLNYRVVDGCAVNLTVRGIAGLNADSGQLTIGLVRPDRSDAALVVLKRSGT